MDDDPSQPTQISHTPCGWCTPHAAWPGRHRILRIFARTCATTASSAPSATMTRPTLFDWLIKALSFQGISDTVAAGYIAEHESVRWSDIGGCVERQGRGDTRSSKLARRVDFLD